MASINARQAYSEIDAFLNLIDEESRNKIPEKLRDFFKREKDANYIKEINPNIPVKIIPEEVLEKNKVKISDVEIISKETVDTSTLVKFNGVLYAKSYALIDYAGDFNNTIGVIDKEYLPNLDGETNSEELLNAKVLEANEEMMVLNCNNVARLFSAIKVVYKTTENNDIVR